MQMPEHVRPLRRPAAQPRPVHDIGDALLDRRDQRDHVRRVVLHVGVLDDRDLLRARASPPAAPPTPCRGWPDAAARHAAARPRTPRRSTPSRPSSHRRRRRSAHRAPTHRSAPRPRRSSPPRCTPGSETRRRCGHSTEPDGRDTAWVDSPRNGCGARQPRRRAPAGRRRGPVPPARRAGAGDRPRRQLDARRHAVDRAPRVAVGAARPRRARARTATTHYSKYGLLLPLLSIVPVLVAQPIGALTGRVDLVEAAAAASIMPLVGGALAAALFLLGRRLGAPRPAAALVAGRHRAGHLPAALRPRLLHRAARRARARRHGRARARRA